MKEVKDVAVEVAKNAAKKRVRIWIISSLAASSFLLPIIGGFIVILAAFVVLGFDSEANENKPSYLFNSDLESSYLLCDSVNVEGELYTLEEYVAGVVSDEAYTDQNMEALKAQAIAARTYVIVRTNNCSVSITSSSDDQNFTSIINERALEATVATSGMVLTKNGHMFLSEYDSFYNGGNFSCDGSKCSVTYKKLPSNEENLVTVSYDYYSYIAGGHGRGMSQVASYYLAEQGYNYEAILRNFYDDDIEIQVLSSSVDNDSSSDSDVSDGNNDTPSDSGSGNNNQPPSNGTVSNGNGFSSFTSSSGKKYLNYKQYYYKKILNNNSTASSWLASSGCGLTSAAIIISSKNRAIDPMYLYNNYRAVDGYVDIQKYLHNHGFSNVNKLDVAINNYEKKLKQHIETGGTAILHSDASCKYKSEKWTNNGHYFVALDYNDNNTPNNYRDDLIYISNPGRNDNAITSGWLNVNSMGCVSISYFVY